jgi:multidrug efflux pump subunit AcrA (membrane-fusion protein)
VGVATIESTAEGPADIASIELVQAALDLVAPVLLIRRSDDRNLALRAAADSVKAGQWLVGPKHTAWKLAGLAAFLAVLLAAVIPLQYRIEAPIVLQPRDAFVAAAPYDGLIGSLPEGIEAGRAVHKGDVLVEMDTTEARLKKIDAQGQLAQAEKEADAYLRAGKLAESEQARARADQARAKLGMAEKRTGPRPHCLHHRRRDRRRGPLRRVGASVKLSDVLFRVASLEDMVIVAQVSDRDIALIHEGQTTGDIATKSDPAKAYPFVVERIVPLAQPKDGKKRLRGPLQAPPSTTPPRASAWRPVSAPAWRASPSSTPASTRRGGSSRAVSAIS